MYTNQKRDNIRKYYHIIFLIVQELIPQKITFQRSIIKGCLALILYREGGGGGRIRLGTFGVGMCRAGLPIRALYKDISF